MGLYTAMLDLEEDLCRYRPYLVHLTLDKRANSHTRIVRNSSLLGTQRLLFRQTEFDLKYSQ